MKGKGERKYRQVAHCEVVVRSLARHAFPVTARGHGLDAEHTGGEVLSRHLATNFEHFVQL